jgi:hypothetical protein
MENTSVEKNEKLDAILSAIERSAWSASIGFDEIEFKDMKAGKVVPAGCHDDRVRRAPHVSREESLLMR